MRLVIALVTALASSVLFAEEKPADKPVNDPAFHAKLLEIAKTYETYGRVDDTYRWAPTDCDFFPQPSKPRFSDSKMDDTNGRKLYYVFASDINAYTPNENERAPAGLVIVKEAWRPEEIPADQAPKTVTRKAILDEATRQKIDDSPGLHAEGRFPRSLDYVETHTVKDGKTYLAKEKSGLFVMVKLDPKTANTDDGWVYATISADGKTVTSAGRVQSCMDCHVNAPRDRLFGLPTEPGK